MDPVIASLMGTVIGGLFGIAGGILTGRRQARLEQERWLQARKDDIEKETRLAVAELTRKMAVATQAMLWFTSKAGNIPKKFSQEDISEYDEAIQGLLPDILSSLMVVSALDTEVSEKMTPLLYRIYEVDGQIAQASTQFETSPRSSVESLARLRSTEVIPLYSELTQRISGITGVTSLEDNLTKRLAPNG
jgi:hypothetical protein